MALKNTQLSLIDRLVGCWYPGSCYSSFCSLVLLTPHNTLGIIYYTLIKEIGKIMICFEGLKVRCGQLGQLMVLLLSVDF